MKLSRQITLFPCANSASVRLLPMKPAPPVTRTLEFVIVLGVVMLSYNVLLGFTMVKIAVHREKRCSQSRASVFVTC